MKRPPPLRTDGSNAFARYSMQERVPRIARDVLQRNPGYSSVIRGAVERLARQIESDDPIPAPRAPAPDVGAWAEAHAEHEGQTWLHAEWFYAEIAFYRELCAACRFWETGRDPFGPAKHEELEGERPWARLESALAGARGDRRTRMGSLLLASLWGNRVDLSYTVAAGRSEHHEEDLLSDDRAPAAALLTRAGANVHVVADNAGTELVLDLAVVAAVLEDPQSRVTVHLKMQPMFVSDAMPADFFGLLARMHDRAPLVRSLAEALASHFASGRLALAPDPFWSGPRFMSDAPAHLTDAFKTATVVMFKGDANYRRVVGDALWPPATPFATASACVPAPVICLRTMKSDSVVGLAPGTAEALDARAPRWRIDGQRAVLQTRDA